MIIHKDEKNVEIELPIRTEKELIAAEKMQARMYERYDRVKIYPHGIDRIRIIGMKQ